MKKLIWIGIGLACAAAFVGFDAVEALFDKTRAEVRSALINPEMELQGQISEAEELAEKCSESVINGQVALARLDAMISERGRELSYRSKAIRRDRTILETRRTMLQEGRQAYLIHDERVSRRTLNRDACLRAKAYQTDREIFGHLEDTLGALKEQRAQTSLEIEQAGSEQARLDSEISNLRAQLENLKARKAVAQTREEAKYVFDRSAFDKARDKIATIRATIAEQNKRLDFYGRRASGHKGLIPADVGMPEDNGVDAITSVLADGVPAGESVLATVEK